MAQKRQPKKQRAFLAAYAQCGVLRRAAEISGISRESHRRWMLTDPAYAEAFERAHEQACDLLESEARRRATEGLLRFKFDKSGQPLKDPRTGEPYYEVEYSDTLLIFLMKGAMPERYRERSNIEMSGPRGEPVRIARELSDDELAAIAAGGGQGTLAPPQGPSALA